eukprot:8538570-Alexandrium_andersonii.AAC.1
MPSCGLGRGQFARCASCQQLPCPAMSRSACLCLSAFLVLFSAPCAGTSQRGVISFSLALLLIAPSALG